MRFLSKHSGIIRPVLIGIAAISAFNSYENRLYILFDLDAQTSFL